MHELIIIGGGPAGVAAGVYAARKRIDTILITELFGGQSMVSDDIQNWIGSKSISGFDLAKMLEEHVKAQEEIEIIESERVVSVKDGDGGFVVETSGGKTLETKTILIASGSRRRRLDVPGGEKFDGKGVAYCSTCDAPLFRDRAVAVVGGGNAGLEAAVDLFPYAKKIYILDHNGSLKGDAQTLEKIENNPKVEAILGANTTEILGDKFVTGLKYEDKDSGEIKELSLGGVFVEIGAVPNTDFMNGLVKLNKFGEVVVDHKTQRTSLGGVWAAGDVSDVLYKQNNISAGDAVKAALNIYNFLQEKKEGSKK